MDLFWIDGAHDHYSVVHDIMMLAKCSSKNAIWVFDDFDKRFGCYNDIRCAIAAADDHIILNLGQTASGNPNVIVIARGIT